ncbi:MAG: FHA domain-containing protein [Kofleriaceae bacterium]
MFVVEVHGPEGELRHVQVDGTEATIGRHVDNDLQLLRGNISKRHARIVQRDATIIVVDLKSTNGTYLNGRKITAPSVVRSRDVIYIGDYRLVVQHAARGDDGPVAHDEVEANEEANEEANDEDDEVTNELGPPAFRARDQVEHQLLVEIAACDDAASVVYADWLEARGELKQAEFLRIQQAILACVSDPPRRDELSACMLALVGSLDLSWRSQVVRAAIEHCPRAGELQCPKEWSKLQLTHHDGVRSCGSCKKKVRYVTMAGEAHLHVANGERVAIAVCGVRWGRDLDPVDARYMCLRCERDAGPGLVHCPRCRGPLRQQVLR